MNFIHTSGPLLVIFVVHCTLCGSVGVHGSRPRFSIQNARRRLRHVSAMPAQIKRYTRGANGTGIYSEWYRDEIELEMICRLLTEGLQFVLTNPFLRTAEVALVRTVVEDFISRAKKRFETVPKPIRAYPWGRNWYGFSVDLTTMLGYYLLLCEPSMRGDAEALIKMLIANPSYSVGVQLRGSNSVYVAGPWILVKLLDGELESAASTSEYKNALEFNRMAIRTRRADEGLHRDRTFIFHSRGVFFHYFESLITDNSSQLLYALDSEARPPLRQWDEVASILFHPTIAFGNVGLLGRVRELRYETNPNSEYGVKVMPFGGYLRYFAKNAQFSVRAQKQHLAFYEPDATVKDLGQYWVQYRCVHRANTNYSVEFPAPGLIGHEGDKGLISIPSPDYTGTAQTYMPKRASSFVMAYGSVGFLYQEYEIAQFGQYSVRELIEVDSNAQTIRISVEIASNETDKNLVYYRPTYWDERDPGNSTVVVRPQELKSICTVVSMKDSSGNSYVHDPRPIEFPMQMGNLKIEKYETAKCFVLFDRARPVVCAPYEWDAEDDSMQVKLNASSLNCTTFIFSSQANQYIASSGSVYLTSQPLMICLQGAFVLALQRVFISSFE